MKHWYVVESVNVPTDSIRAGDVIGFSHQNPNLTKFVDGHFVPMANWIYIGRWEAPPIDDFKRALALINARDLERST